MLLRLLLLLALLVLLLRDKTGDGANVTDDTDGKDPGNDEDDSSVIPDVCDFGDELGHECIAGIDNPWCRCC